MAKVSVNKLGLKLNQEIKTINYNDQIIEIKQYLPLIEKLELISRVINQSIDDNGFYNPMRVNLYLTIETIFAYTNLNFTEKLKEDPFKIYDTFISTGLFDKIIENIGEKEWKTLQNNIQDSIENIYTYRNSVMGILDAVSTDYNDLNLDAQAIKDQLSNQDNLKLLKDVITKLG